MFLTNYTVVKFIKKSQDGEGNHEENTKEYNLIANVIIIQHVIRLPLRTKSQSSKNFQEQIKNQISTLGITEDYLLTRKLEFDAEDLRSLKGEVRIEGTKGELNVFQMACLSPSNSLL